jgi:hypothetical protein
MNRNTFSHWITLSLLLTLAVLACGAPASVTAPPEPTEIQTEPADTATVPPTINAETPAGTDPSCNVLQDLNLRFGPGTAYRPPIRVLPANSVLTPLGFAPQGVPGGSWAYVQDSATQDEGWVSAGAQYISCNVELAALPAVAYGTPPPFFPSTSQVSPGPGNCGKGGTVLDNGDVYDCSVEFSEDYLMRFVILKNGVEIGENDGVNDVSFTASKDGDTVYVIVEELAAYCIFGGNAPCNSWVIEDGVYKWEAGGAVVDEGEYHIDISGNVTDSEGNFMGFAWQADVTVTLP